MLALGVAGGDGTSVDIFIISCNKQTRWTSETRLAVKSEDQSYQRLFTLYPLVTMIVYIEDSVAIHRLAVSYFSLLRINPPAKLLAWLKCHQRK